MTRSTSWSRLRRFVAAAVVAVAIPAALATTESSAACSTNYLNEWSGAGFTGTNMVVGPFGAWYNYAAGNEATTTSFKTGEGDVVFSGHVDGGGAQYPGPGYCTSVSDLTGSAWNNRFRSRKRIP